MEILGKPRVSQHREPGIALAIFFLTGSGLERL